jgi:hypothetical protein
METIDVPFTSPICMLYDAAETLPHLCDPWPTQTVHDPTNGPVNALVVACTDSADQIRQLCCAWPSAHILAVCSTSAGNEDVAALLNAGAEACVRQEHPAVIRAHLLAMGRRLTHG